jgi:hypothetical protein
MTALERLAALKAAVVLRQTTMGATAKACGVSYNHFWLVVGGRRVGSSGLQAKIAAVIGRSVNEVFPPNSRQLG